MRKIDFQKDQEFYSQYTAPSVYTKDYLDIYRFNITLKFLRKKFNLKKPLENKTILNVASGYGREAYIILSICKPQKIILIDYSFNQLNEAKKYLKEFDQKYLIRGDAENIPFKDKSVDICFINEALHHFVNPLKSLTEFIRVAKEIIILDEPFERRVICKVLESIFLFLKIKEKFERGYLEAFRIKRSILNKISQEYKIKIVCYPYFIYYFEWYKNIRVKFIKLLY